MRILGIVLGGVALVAAAVLLVPMPAPEAQAATRICRQLEAELASAGNGGSGRISRYDDAIARQREQMAIAREQAEDAGCGFALLGRSVRQCAALNATIDRMVRNLDSLQRQRAKMAGGGGKRPRAKLLAALEANGCRDERTAERPPAEEEPLEAMADPDAAPSRPMTPLEMMLEEDATQESPPLRARAGETYQTMCVRTCDGYFFPISYASTVGDFDRDLKNCETSCPGTDMQVFFGPSGVDEPATMVSTASGRRYSEIPTAFLHQRTDVPQAPGCGCNPKKDFKVIAGTPPASQRAVWPPDTPAEPAEQAPSQEGPVSGEQPAAPAQLDADIAATAPAGEMQPTETPPADLPRTSIVTIPLPEAARPKPAEPQAEAPANPPSTETAMPENPAERKVRVVGPKFLPDPAEAETPQAQGLKQGP